ncbi:hypothetical protein RI129_012533 [Pyrocoelia pectoralis]|uniref:UDP-glucuronosyltransferase n=1 Tax=Pyrocoelia pectoralis TaxID=417401 RepID=A0AAN7V2G3_9COLE
MVVLFISFLAIISSGDSARILGVIPIPSYSHQVVFQPLWRELSLRGHQVTTLTTDPINDPSLINLTEIDLGFSYDVWNEAVKSVGGIQSNILKTMRIIESGVSIARTQLRHPLVQDLLENNNITFDLVMVEYYMPSALVFAKRFNCPYIGVVSMDAHSASLKLAGNPTHPILYPNNLLSVKDSLTLFDRIKSVVFSLIFEVYINYIYYSHHQEVVETIFGNHYPPLRDIARNVSLLFINSDPIFDKVKPLVPTVIQIGGGLSRKASKPLSRKLQKILDVSSAGVVYFSLGSNVKSKDLPNDTINTVLATFAELPYTILWKFESGDLPNKSRNVYVEKWFPQLEVLKHPNIKLFITQGGLQSIEEAIYTQIPMVGMPFFGDQFYNVKKMVKMGFGLIVDHTTLKIEELNSTIMEVIQNPKYKEKLKELSELVLDQPMTGLERAVWWREYVIRHKGATHLRSPLLDIPFYQYYLLDVITVLLLLLALVVYIVKVSITVMSIPVRRFYSKVKRR